MIITGKHYGSGLHVRPLPHESKFLEVPKTVSRHANLPILDTERGSL